MTGTGKLLAPQDGVATGERLQAGLQSLLESLAITRKELDEAAKSYPGLASPARAIGRIARAASRPFRIAILGESNSGKSSIANFLSGGLTLPASPVANTRLPTLLYHASYPAVRALLPGGERVPLSPSRTPGSGIVRLEVGLPSEFLRRVELLDFPGSANPLFPTHPEAALAHGIDAAIWATVATQAWRETERAAWSRLPPRIVSRGVLAVTHCDLIAAKEDFARLKARLQAAAGLQFAAVCFSGGIGTGRAKAPTSGAGLFSAVLHLSHIFAGERLDRALHLAHMLAGQTLARLEAGERAA